MGTLGGIGELAKEALGDFAASKSAPAKAKNESIAGGSPPGVPKIKGQG